MAYDASLILDSPIKISSVLRSLAPFFLLTTKSKMMEMTSKAAPALTCTVKAVQCGLC